MQCPNCGKEAINVNGRYVCLDCGIEITSGEAQPAVETSVTNHTEPVVEVPPVEPAPVPTEPKVETPVYNEFIQELNSSAPADAPKEADAPIPDFPVGTPTEQPAASPAPLDPAPISVGEPPLPGPNPFDPAPVGPVADSQATMAEPAPTTTATLEPVVSPTPDMSPVAAVPGPAAVTDTNPTPEVTSAPVNEPSFVAPAPVEPAVNATPASAVQAEPENYFQPSSLDITQNNPAPVVESPTQPLQGEATTPAPNPTEASNFFDQSEPVTPAVDPLATAPTPDPSYSATPTEPAREIFETPTSSLDDLLSQYSGGTAPVAPAPAPTPTPNPIYPGPQTTGDVADPYPSTPTSPQPVSVPQNPPTMPGANNIPDPASVFGPGTTPMPPVKRPLNKWWVIGGASAAVLLLAGLVFLGISLFKPKESTDPNVVREEETLKYSELVGKAMDPNQNMVTTFDQTLDFSGTEVKASDQNGELMKLLFAEPVAAKGNWQSDQAGNISLDGSFANVASKRIYIDGEKGTYVFSNEAGTWNKSDGYQFGIIPPFFSPENKGGLFYVSKNDEITYLNDEELDGNTYKKIKLFPKKEIFQSFISGSNALLANLKYEEVTTDNIEVFAWIEESGKIHKVSVQGDLGIKSDLFDGTVKVSSTAGYEYKEVKITKP